MRSFLWTLALAGLPVLSTAQPVLQLRTGDVSTIPVERARAALVASASVDGQVPAFLVFDHTLNAPERVRCTELGVRFLHPLKGHAWSVLLRTDTDLDRLAGLGLSGVHLPRAQDRVHPSLAVDLAGNDRRARHAVTVLPWTPSHAALLRERAGALVQAELPAIGGLIMELDGRTIERLAEDVLVQWIEPAPEEGEPEDLRGRTLHRVYALGTDVAGSPGLDGTGVVAVVNDDGFVGPHIDFTGRTEQSDVAGDLTGDHGDMVAGILGGAGNLDPRQQGMAPGAHLIIRQYSGNMPNTVDLYQDEGAVIFSSSYSNGCNVGYTSTTQLVDDEIYDNPAIIQVFSAGNNGTTDCGFGAGDFWGNITGGHKQGKNVIATANLNDIDVLAGSSSRGPSTDGRIKPDIGAYGNSQTSTYPPNTYGPGGGTSAAAPGVSGTLAVLYQGWRELHGGDPNSGLMKAFLLNAADDLGNTGPDFRFGWGRLNGARAWQAIDRDQWTTGSLDQGQSATHNIEVPAGTAELRVMLYWTDPAASLQAQEALVNDLDLTGTAPDLTGHLPWHLDPTPDPAILNTPATKAPDHLNNVEQVHAVDPVTGTWSFTVEAFDVPSGPQEYFLVYDLIPDSIRITYPLAGDVLTSDESHRFRWDALGNTDPFTVSLSLDSGMTWNAYPAVSGDRRYFDLGLGDTLFLHCFLRVERNGQLAESGPFRIQHAADDLEVLFNCPDSMGLAWPPVEGASAYVMHRLGAQYMDSVALTSDTAFVFTGLVPGAADWFAVTALDALGRPSRRSIAIPRPTQLQNCQAGQDLFVESVLSPGPVLLQCQSDPAVRYVVRNGGSHAVEGFATGFQVNGNAPVNVQMTDTIAPGDSLLVELPQQSLGMANNVTNLFRVFASSLQEQFPPNDTLSMEVLRTGNFAWIPLQENFDNEVACSTSNVCDTPCDEVGLFRNAMNGGEDDIDWRVDTAGTQTADTGPALDHTMGDEYGRYIYLEASGGCTQQEALLTGPCLQLPTSTPAQLTFWYHLQGSGMGELHVDLYADGDLVLDIMPPLIGDQGDAWQQAAVSLAPWAGQVVTVRFRGVTGPTHVSDMALDDIGVSLTTGISELNGAAPLVVTPEREAGLFRVDLPGTGQVSDQLQVLDAQGRLVHVQDLSGLRTLPLDLRSRPAGLYLLRAMLAGTPRTARVVRP